MESFKDEQKKKTIEAHFDGISGERDFWQKKNRYYYEDQHNYYRFLIAEGLRVLEIGCGLGDVLAAVKPCRGLGIDLSGRMVDQAQRRHPHLEFRQGDVETLDLRETFDVIILADVVGNLLDVQLALKNLNQCCTSKTRLIISYYNFLWEPILQFGELVRRRMPQHHQNWLAPDDIVNFLGLANYEVIKREYRFLFPLKIPVVSSFVNKFVAFLPGIRKACLSHYIISRPIQQKSESQHYSTTIVIPCRNERGNIEPAIQRLPVFGGQQEIIYVDGHSTDGTQDEIKRVVRQYPERQIHFLVQDGKGKGDAVRKGFAHAKADILMILDADLTTPPEDLPKFFNAITQGKGEFINGSRLVYPMEKQAMRLLNLFGNKFFSLAFSWLLNQRLKDTLCGTKVLYREDYIRIKNNRGYFGDFDPFGDFDLLFGASKLNLKILEVPIRYQDRTYGTTNIHRFAHGWLLLKMTIYGFFKLKAV